MQIDSDRAEPLTSIQTLEFVLNAWEEALEDGHDPGLLANAALFAAFSGLVSAYGEEAVAELAMGLPRRIMKGEFSARVALQ